MLYYNHKEKRKGLEKMTTLRTCDFETYCEIENYVFNTLEEENIDIRGFASTLGVTVTDEELQQLIWDCEEAY